MKILQIKLAFESIVYVQPILLDVLLRVLSEVFPFMVWVISIELFEVMFPRFLL